MNENLLKNIEKDKKEKKRLPLTVLNEINKKALKNVLIAITVVCYFIFINLGYFNIKKDILITDLNVFSICALGLTVFLFERAYKKDSGEIAINGIECLVVAIITLGIPYAFFYTNVIYKYMIYNMGLIFSLYYSIKNIIIYFREKKKYLNSLSDIKNIIKKEKKDDKVEDKEEFTKKSKKVEKTIKEEVIEENIIEKNEKVKKTPAKKSTPAKSAVKKNGTTKTTEKKANAKKATTKKSTTSETKKVANKKTNKTV